MLTRKNNFIFILGNKQHNQQQTHFKMLTVQMMQDLNQIQLMFQKNFNVMIMIVIIQVVVKLPHVVVKLTHVVVLNQSVVMVLVLVQKLILTMTVEVKEKRMTKKMKKISMKIQVNQNVFDLLLVN